METLRFAPALLSLSAAGLLAIAGYEGFRASAYNDGAGVQTIGYGTTQYDTGAPVRAGDKITPERALVQLGAAASRTEQRLAACIAVPLAQREWDALVSWAYNVGTGAACKSTLVRRLNAGDYNAPCVELPKWNRAGGRVLAGLAKRRAAEARMYGCKQEETDDGK